MMLPRRLLLVTLVATASLACAGFPDLRDVEIPDAAIVEPWKGMKLPIGDGHVVYCTDKAMSVQYRGDKVQNIANKYKKAMKREGFKKVGEVSNEGTITLTYEKKKDRVSMAITSAVGKTVVAMTAS